MCENRRLSFILLTILIYNAILRGNKLTYSYTLHTYTHTRACARTSEWVCISSNLFQCDKLKYFSILKI